MMSEFNPNNYDDVMRVVEFIKDKIGNNNGLAKKPEILIICGSGLGSLADEVKKPVKIAYKDIPHFPVGNVQGHKGCLLFGELEGKNVMCMQGDHITTSVNGGTTAGRVHPYEGKSLALCALPIRVGKLLGIKSMLMTSAVGGINTNFKVGDLMVVKDHLFVPGVSLKSPLVGENDERFGARFTSSTNLYDLELRKLAHRVADTQGLTLRTGIYAMSGGPQFETPAEIRWFALSGADVIGMSVCHETVVARHCGIKVLALTLITNMSEHDSDAPQQEGLHEEVLKAGQVAAKHTALLVKAILAQM